MQSSTRFNLLGFNLFGFSLRGFSLRLGSVGWSTPIPQGVRLLLDLLQDREPTFTGQYIHWNSFGPKQRKTNLIYTLTHRVLKICSKSTLKHELENIRSIFVQNGYPEFLIDSRISKTLLRFQQNTKEGPKKCPVQWWILGEANEAVASGPPSILRAPP